MDSSDDDALNNKCAVEFFNPTSLTARNKIVSELGRGTIFLPFNHQLLLTPDLKIHAIGGGGNCFSFGTHLNGDVVSFDLVKAIQCLAQGERSSRDVSKERDDSVDSSPSPVQSRRSSGQARLSGEGVGSRGRRISKDEIFEEEREARQNSRCVIS